VSDLDQIIKYLNGIDR